MTSVDAGMSAIAFTFAWSGFSPSSVATCPINGTLVCRKCSLPALRTRFSLSHLLRKATRFSSCFFVACSMVSPYPTTRKSSATTSTPTRPSMTSCIRRWKTSGAEQILNGSHLQQYRPKGVWNVVSRLDFLSILMCQNPFLASSLVNTLAQFNRVATSSIVGSWYFSRCTALFKSFGSKQIRTFPLGFTTVIIELIQGAVSVTFCTMPSFSSSSSFLWTFPLLPPAASLVHAEPAAR